jgi:hypothetical protein
MNLVYSERTYLCQNEHINQRSENEQQHTVFLSDQVQKLVQKYSNYAAEKDVQN